MKTNSFQPIRIEREDFTGRDHYPGTAGHPINIINVLNQIVEKLPAPLYSVIFGGILHLISQDRAMALIYVGFVFFDWLLLVLLPKFHISYGPPTLTLTILALLRLPFWLFRFPLAITFQGLGTLLVIYAFYLEPQRPKLERYQVSIINAPHRQNSFKIVHLSDLHMAYFSQREEKIIQMVNAIDPDLILFTGDFFNLSNQYDPQTIRDITSFFSQLKAKYGKFAVTGSPAVDTPESLASLPKDLPITILQNESQIVDLEGIAIRLTGVSCSHQPDDDFEVLKSVLAAEEAETDASILLYHSPDLAPAAATLPIDLQLSGHTHGGQVQLPLIGPIFTGTLYGLKFISGAYFVNQHLRLIISRGLGLEGNAAPRVRFLAPPEVGLITLEFCRDNVK